MSLRWRMRQPGRQSLRPRLLPIQGGLCPHLRLRRRPGTREGSWRSFPFGVGTSVFRIAHERFSSAVSLCFHCRSTNFGGLPFGGGKERRERQRACSKRRSIGQKKTSSVWKLSGRKCQGRTVLWNALTAERVANKAA